MLRERDIKFITGAFRANYEEEEIMTGKEIYEALMQYMQDELAPTWISKKGPIGDMEKKEQAEFQEAISLGLTNGSNPMVLIPRYQAAIMSKRAAKK